MCAVPSGGLSKFQLSSLTEEIMCLWELGASHINVIQPRELLLTQDHVVLVTE